MLDVERGCCQPGSRRGECCISPPPVLTLSSTLPRTALPAGGRHVWPPRLRGGSSEAPRMKLGVPVRRCTLRFAVLGAKCSGMCDRGAHPMRGGGWGCPPLPLTSSGRPIGVNGRLYAPVPAGSRAVETARGQTPLANKTVLFAVGEQEFRGVVWQEARTLAYWKRVCPGAHLVFFPSPLLISLHFSSSAQFLLPRPPQHPFPLSFPSTTSPLVPCSWAGGGGRQEELGVPLPRRGAAALTAVRAVG